MECGSGVLALPWPLGRSQLPLLIAAASSCGPRPRQLDAAAMESGSCRLPRAHGSASTPLPHSISEQPLILPARGLFQSGTRDVVKRLANKEFDTAEERDELLARLAAAEDLRAQDVVWMLFRPDRALRDAGAKLLQRLRDPETLSVFLGEAKGKPEAAFRAATGGLLQPRTARARDRAPEAPRAGEGDERNARDAGPRAAHDPRGARRAARSSRCCGSSPRPVLATTASRFSPDSPRRSRTSAASRAGSKLVQDPDPRVREKALEVLATRAPLSVVDLFVQHLPLVGYSTSSRC